MNKLKIVLQKYFGYDEFKSGQEEVIRSVLNCVDTLAVMPTGGGKSLCYQLPAMLLQGTVIVISPLIALMKDQVDSLEHGGIPATSINSTMSYADIYQRLANAADGKYKMLYVAPERLASRSFLELLRTLEIPFIAVDEAHCISEWGHDFRPSYLNINKIFDFIPRCPVLALTATATDEVQEDIVKSLKLNNPNRIVKGFDRKNLRYYTEYSDKKAAYIADIYSSTPTGSTIVYAGSRKRVEQFTSELHSLGVKAESYHAGMRVLLRNAVQERFITGKTRVIVATNAFGMGIDKYDVRNVFHVDYPLTLESYYQEAGRAGRDGKISGCYLLFNDTDRALPEFFIKSTYPDRKSIDLILSELIAYSRQQRFSDDDNNSVPEPLVMANTLGIDYRTTESVYGLLERAAILGKGSIQSQAKIRISTSRERITEYFNNSVPERQEALEALLRSVSPDVFERMVPISTKDLIMKHSISKKDIDDLIKSMQMLNLIQFYSENQMSGYYLNKISENPSEIKFNTLELSRRCALALHKLDYVLEYSMTNECKRNFILDYFNDSQYSGKCSYCTSCKTVQIKNNVSTSSYRFLKYIILDGLEGNSEPVDTKEFQKTIAGEIKNSDFLLEKIDIKNGNIIPLINNEIYNLNINRLIEFDNKYKNKISITQTGIEYLKHLPEQSGIMARNEKDKSRSDIIFCKLVTLRREIAEHAGVVPRGIISDVAMRKIADVMPETEYDLKNVSGVSQLFVQKFAKLFLQELAKIKLNPKEQKVSKVAQDALKLLAQGENFETIKTRLFAGNMTMAANYIVEIIEAGHPLPRKELVPDTIYSKVKSCIKKNPDFGTRDLQAKLTLDTDASTLKIAAAFAKLELGFI
ncbi:MAG: RecQ family ATP-dependent DNA helicase [Candidatus Kapabacteria bacterium]|nr:RecQ family ATP-dependent DNA helicase [Candidatus Kapabacteria bacterium]